MITSTSNIQVKELLRLQKKSREREKEGVFIVEGPRIFFRCQQIASKDSEKYVLSSLIQ